MTNFLGLAKDRYSVRKFSDKPVEPEKIEQILEAAIVAPTACNNQPYKVWVIESEEALEKMREVTPNHFGASLIFAVGGSLEEAWVRRLDQKNFVDVDATIVATQMMLAIHDLGLGTTWVGWFDNDKLMEKFPEMQGYSVVALFPVGYPAEDSKPAEFHTKYRPYEELVAKL